jgi:DNA-binding NarL/FixJ family response regulator
MKTLEALDDFPHVLAASGCDHCRVRPTVLIVDDHAGFRRAARRVLEAEGFDVVGESADGRSAIALVRSLRPHVVLVDVLLPDIDGFAVAERLRDEDPPTITVLTSSHDRVELAARLVTAPARGFIPKSELSGAALRAITEGSA